MFEWLEKLQKKPAPVRKSIALFATRVIMAPVLAVWFFSLPLVGGVSNIAGAGSAQSPFSVIGEEFRSIYREAREGLNDVPQLEYVPNE
jgi:hypothetical protein